MSKVVKRMNCAVCVSCGHKTVLANAATLHFFSEQPVKAWHCCHIPQRKHGVSWVIRPTCVVTLRTSAGEISPSRLPVASSSSSSSSLTAFPFLLLHHSSLPSINPRAGHFKSVMIIRSFQLFLAVHFLVLPRFHSPYFRQLLGKDAVGGLLTAH